MVKRDDILDLKPWLQVLRGFLPSTHLLASSPVFVSFTRTAGGAQRFWAVSRDQFTYRFKTVVRDVLGFDPALLSGYSIRRGGVTALVSADCPLPVITRHVGWAPASHAIYLYYDHSGTAQRSLPTAWLKAL
jgi:hypothetical protein